MLGLILEVFRSSNPFILPAEELTVREALERSRPLLESGLRDQPAVRAALLHSSGSILSAVGKYQPAADQLKEALAIRRELYGDSNADVVETITALAALHKELEELAEAEALVRRRSNSRAVSTTTNRRA